MRLLLLALISSGSLTAATVHQGTLALLTGPGDLDATGVITAGSPYDAAVREVVRTAPGSPAGSISGTPTRR
jgi:hypothetical protein